MKKKFSVEQIVSVLKQAEVGVPIAELIRKVGISEQTFYRWKSKYVGPDPSTEAAAGREHTAEAVGGRADAGQDDASGRAQKKVVKPSRRRPFVKYLEQSYRVSERHACCVLEVARATHRYEGHPEQWIELRMRIREIAQTRGTLWLSHDPRAVES
jgi:putative transposase